MRQLVKRRGFWLIAAAALACSAGTLSADTPSQLFVERAYHDLLSRVPDPSALSTFSSAIDSNSLTRQQVADSITSSDEFHGDETQQQYEALLHRAADQLSLNVWINALHSGTTVEQLQANLAGSSEYFTNRGGGTNDGFLTALYPDFLGRPISPSERSADDTALSGGESRTALAGSIAGSQEFDQHLVAGWYPEFLHRPADPGSVFYVNELQANVRNEQVIAQIVGSAEYSMLPLLPGDANFDQNVGFDDVLTLIQNYGHGGAHWFNGDFNGDGQVGFDDVLTLIQNYGRSAAAVANSSPVPEPAGAMIVLVAAPLLLKRR
jgi:Domain of unknown function (DUF4214)